MWFAHAQIAKGMHRTEVPTRRSAVVASGVPPRTVEHRHCRASTHSTKKLQVRCSSSGIFLEMGQSHCAQGHHRQSLGEVFLSLRRPKEVTVDNGKQFDCATFRDFTT